MSNSPKGYPISIIIGGQIINYVCVFCNSIFIDPVQSSCGHRFCKLCIRNIIEESIDEVLCPTCVQEGNNDQDMILSHNKIHNDKAFNRDLSILNVKCFNNDCPWIGFYKDLKDHLLECNYSTVICPLCEKPIQRTEEHECMVKTKCLLACHHNYGGSNEIKLSKSICRHFLTFDKIITNLQENSGLSDESKITLSNRISKLESAFNNRVLSDANNADSLTNTNANVLINQSIENIQNLLANEVFKEYLHKEIQLEIVNLIETLIRDISLKTRDVEELKEKTSECEKQLAIKKLSITNLENKLLISEARNQDLTIKLNNLDQTTYDGTFIWCITEFAKKRDDAISGRITSIYSSPFYTSKYGYKMSVRIYLNGDGMGKGSHISLFFVIMRGNYDSLLSWPFKHKVTMTFLDQSQKNHIVDAFKPDPTSSSFRRPVNEMNIASGCPMFMPLNKLDESVNAYVKDDTAFIKIVVDVTG